MGKYPSPDPYTDEELELNRIANELAEVNRLKRLEMSMQKYTNENGIVIPSFLELDLKDEA